MWIDDLKKRIQRRIAASEIAAVEQAAARNYHIRLREATDAQQAADDAAGFRRLSTVASEKLNPLDSDKLNRMCWYLYRTNPLARRMVQIIRDFCRGMSPECGEGVDPKVKDVVEDFWNDPYNRMAVFIGDIVERRALEGETLLPVRVNPQDGKVFLDFEEPREIDKLELADSRYVATVTMKIKSGQKTAKAYDVIRYQTDPTAKMRIGEAATNNERDADVYGYRVGTAFYFRGNHLITGRGRPSMEASIDWLDAHDHALFDQFRNVALTGAFVWDVEIDGNDTQVNARADELQTKGPPKVGSINVHNKGEVWEAKYPKIDATVAVDLPTEARKIIGLGFGVSETWIAASKDVNRSTSETADGPPLRHMAGLQDDIEWMIRDIIDFVIDMAILHGKVTIDPDKPELRAFTVQKPDLTSADNVATAKALLDLTSGGQMAIDMGLCDLESLRNLWYATAGIPRPADLDKAVKKAKEEEKVQDYKSTPFTKQQDATAESDALAAAALGKGKSDE